MILEIYEQNKLININENVINLTISTDEVRTIEILTGKQGAPGIGLPNGGTIGQLLAKKTNAEGVTEWINQSDIIITESQISDFGNYLDKTLDTADDLTEGDTNIYFTNDRAKSALSGLYEVPLTFSSGILRTGNSVTNTDKGSSAVSSHNLEYDHTLIPTALQDLSALTTDDLTEGSTNLYDKPVSLTEGANIGISGTYPNFTIAYTGTAGTNDKVKYDANDPIAGFINDKFKSGTGIVFTEGTGVDENKLIISNSGVITETDPVFNTWINNNPTSGTNTGDQTLPVNSDFSLSSLNDVDDTDKSEGKILKVNSDGTHIYVTDESGTDEKVKFNIDDPIAGYIQDKFVAGDGITLSEGTSVDENKLIIINSDKGSDVDLTNKLDNPSSFSIDYYEKSLSTGFMHSSIVVGEYVFIGSRSNPAKIIRLNINDLEDVSEIEAGVGYIEAVTYNKQTNKLYFLQGYAPSTKVVEVDPLTMDFRILTSTFICGASGGIASDGTYLYIISYSTANIAKFTVNNDSLILTKLNEVSVSGASVAHSLIYDDQNNSLFATGASSPSWCAKITPDDLSSTLLELPDINVLTDDITLSPNHIWAISESAPYRIVKINKDMTDYDVISFKVNSTGYSIAYNPYDRNIYAAYDDGTLLKIDDSMNIISSLAFSSSINEVVFSQEQIFVTTWGSTPAKLIRLSNPKFIGLYHYNDLYEIDYSISNGELTSKKVITERALIGDVTDDTITTFIAKQTGEIQRIDDRLGTLDWNTAAFATDGPIPANLGNVYTYKSYPYKFIGGEKIFAENPITTEPLLDTFENSVFSPIIPWMFGEGIDFTTVVDGFIIVRDINGSGFYDYIDINPTDTPDQFYGMMVIDAQVTWSYSESLTFPVAYIINSVFKSDIFQSDLETGTVFDINSSTMNPNLNADLLDGNHARDFISTPDNYVLDKGELTLSTGYAHASISLNNQIFLGTRTTPSKIIKIPNPQDFSVSVEEINGTDKTESVCYNENNGMLYFLYAGGNPTGTTTIREVNPETMENRILTYASFNPNLIPAITTDGTYLYVVQSVFTGGNNKVVKFLVNTDSTILTLVEETIIDSEASGGHSIIYDKETGYLFATGTLGWIAKIDPTDLSIVQYFRNSSELTGGSDDIALSPDYVWSIRESIPYQMIRYSKADLSDYILIETGENAAGYGAFYNKYDKKIYSPFSNGHYIVIDPNKNKLEVYDSGYTNINEMFFTPYQIFYTTWTNPAKLIREGKATLLRSNFFDSNGNNILNVQNGIIRTERSLVGDVTDDTTTILQVNKSAKVVRESISGPSDFYEGEAVKDNGGTFEANLGKIYNYNYYAFNIINGQKTYNNPLTSSLDDSWWEGYFGVLHTIQSVNVDGITILREIIDGENHEYYTAEFLSVDYEGVLPTSIAEEDIYFYSYHETIPSFPTTYAINSTMESDIFVSTLATGIAPFDINSTTVNTNLNADLLDGHHASHFATGGGSAIGTNTGDQSSSDFDIKDLTDSTNLRNNWATKSFAIAMATAL